MKIEVDSSFLEAEYYLTAPAKGKIYRFENGVCSIAFDFYIDPTAQIKTCAICVSFPEYMQEKIINIIKDLMFDSDYTVRRIYEGDLDRVYKEINETKRRDFQKRYLRKNIFKRISEFLTKK